VFTLYEDFVCGQREDGYITHFERMHGECTGRTSDFFHRKPNEFNKQRQALANIITLTTKPLLASFKVAYRTAKCEGSHSNREGLTLPAVETMHGESYAAYR
jgi:hypothetical protein